MIYTGPIDEFFDYRYGKLPVSLAGVQASRRTIAAVFQPVRRSSTIRTSTRYTRITEFKYLTGQEHPKTSDRLRVPARRRRSVLSRPAARERGAVQAVQGAGGRHARRAFRRPAGDVQVLQHGSGRRRRRSRCLRRIAAGGAERRWIAERSRAQSASQPAADDTVTPLNAQNPAFPFGASLG